MRFPRWLTYRVVHIPPATRRTEAPIDSPMANLTKQLSARSAGTKRRMTNIKISTLHAALTTEHDDRRQASATAAEQARKKTADA